MSDYFLSPQAVSDLAEINDYLFASNQAAADTFLDKISQKFERLAQFPKIGRRRDELSPSQTATGLMVVTFAIPLCHIAFDSRCPIPSEWSFELSFKLVSD